MKRVIEVTGRTGRFDVPFFPLSEHERLDITIKGNDVRIGTYYTTVYNGKEAKRFKGNQFTLYPEYLKSKEGDVLTFALELRAHDGRIIVPAATSEVDKDGFIIEPLLIEDVRGQQTALAWYAQLETRTLELVKRVETLEATVKEMHEKIETAKREAILEATGYDPLNG